MAGNTTTALLDQSVSLQFHMQGGSYLVSAMKTFTEYKISSGHLNALILQPQHVWSI